MDHTKAELPEAHLKLSESNSSLAIGLRLEDSEEETQVPDLEKALHDPQAPVSRTSTAVRRVVTAQDWTGPDDPENPHNWPLRKRIWHTVQPGLFGFAVYVKNLFVLAMLQLD
jgi:hypothetical protein